MRLPIRDVVYGVLLAGVVISGFHAFYFQHQHIVMLQEQINYLQAGFKFLQHFSTGQ